MPMATTMNLKMTMMPKERNKTMTLHNTIKELKEWAVNDLGGIYGLPPLPDDREYGRVPGFNTVTCPACGELILEGDGHMMEPNRLKFVCPECGKDFLK